jgi:hypothetical protein
MTKLTEQERQLLQLIRSHDAARWAETKRHGRKFETHQVSDGVGFFGIN